MAPLAIASSASARMASISAGVAGRCRSGMTAARSVEWPTMQAALTAAGVARSASR